MNQPLKIVKKKSWCRPENPYKQRFFMDHDDDILCLATDRGSHYVTLGRFSRAGPKNKTMCEDLDSESVADMYPVASSLVSCILL